MSPGDAKKFMFCDTHLNSHVTSRQAVVFGDCYAYCGVSVLYVGACGCPNHCGSHGTCSNGVCVCESGWRGQDCQSVDEGNTCSGNGHVKTVGKDLFCVCEAGFSGPFCGQKPPSFSYPIYDLPGAPPEYSPLDPFGDNHPIFNLSSIGTMRISMDEEIFAGYLLSPWNLYNASYSEANMSYVNEVVQVSTQIKWRVKGQTTRTNIKKGWDIKFGKHNRFFGLDKLAIKNGNGHTPSADSILKAMLECLALRGANVPVGRTSFFVLYVNDRFEGLYYFEESGDQRPFLESRFGTSQGNLMKLHWHVILQYLGSNPKTYLDMRMTLFDNQTTAYYRQVDSKKKTNRP